MKTDTTAGINRTSDMNLNYQTLKSREAPQHSSKKLKVDSVSISDTLETTDREGNEKNEFYPESNEAPPKPGANLDIIG